MVPAIPKVALLVETSREYGRGLLRGIVRYASLHGPWTFHLSPGDFAQTLPQMLEWGGCGIIARIENSTVARAILETGLPLVALDLSADQRKTGSPLADVCEVRSDSECAGHLAAEHLLERGFRHYGFVGLAGRIWSDLREQAFTRRLQRSGYTLCRYASPRRREDQDWGREQRRLEQWLIELPKPVGILACNDDRGRQVLEACRMIGVKVPEEVSVIGIDNDELLCELSCPPLSSVRLNPEQGGYRAAELLDRMMRNRACGLPAYDEVSCGPKRILVEATWVVRRRSTEIDVSDDREVAAALSYIRDHAGMGVNVNDVASAVSLSRRSLELRFRASLGRTIHEMIERMKLDRAVRILAETDLCVEEAAEASGFTTASHFVQVFRRRIGTTPAKYRQRSRMRDPNTKDS